MAINIFSGSGSGANKKSQSNKASNSDRVKAAKAALSPTSEVSTSGSTAVESKGSLGKVGKLIGNVAGVASKLLPGLGGTLAGAVSNLFNDPEWWQSVPGDALTLNELLRLTDIGQLDQFDGSVKGPVYSLRSAILEFNPPVKHDTDMNNPLNPATFAYTMANFGFSAFRPTTRMITQYLMPEIRKVVNAVPLQTASDYLAAIESGAQIYAMWRQLKKIDYMAKHGQTYLASMNDVAFPLLQTENASWLQSTINRLEEYLRANVRLPHTLCEYLAWRFGRVYKSNNSAKAALVLYDVVPLCCEPKVWDLAISFYMEAIAAVPSIQKANTDLYNTYYDHDYMVEIREDTQFKFDTKEFMLRLNLTGCHVTGTAPDYSLEFNTVTRPRTCIDSSLDNPTAFMASTVSQYGQDTAGESESCLFPVGDVATVYVPIGNIIPKTSYPLGVRFANVTGNVNNLVAAWLLSPAATLKVDSTNTATTGYPEFPSASGDWSMYSSVWAFGEISLDDINDEESMPRVIASLILSKAVDLYQFVAPFPVITNYNPKATSAQTPKDIFIDASALSIDAGAPTLTTIATEHVYAFANLVSIERKHSLSYKQAEHLVARDVANTIEQMDIATKS